MTIDPSIKALKTRLGDRAEILYMDDLKVSMDSTETAQKVHSVGKMNALSVGMAVTKNKGAIQLDGETPPRIPPRNPKNGCDNVQAH